MLLFKSLLNYPKGTLEAILNEAYAVFHEEHPEYMEENQGLFQECDRFFYENPQIGQSCSFVSEYQGMIAGMACWDPRAKPVVTIGHNCILPHLRGQGLGSCQMKMLLVHLKTQGFVKAKVSTGTMDFYIPAQQMYESAGFKEVHRDVPENANPVRMHDSVYYKVDLSYL